MANKKLKIQVTDEQLERLYKSLKNGTPLDIALQSAGIKAATYSYWVAISSVVEVVKSQEEIEEIEKLVKSGIDIESVRAYAETLSKGKKTTIGAFIEPKEETILRYKNERKFHEFADQVYAIISTCNKLRAEVVDNKLNVITASTFRKNGVNPSGAMWWLERNLPDYYAKANEKSESETVTETVPSITVEYIDPQSEESKKRLLDMEEEIEREYKSGGSA